MQPALGVVGLLESEATSGLPLSRFSVDHCPHATVRYANWRAKLSYFDRGAMYGEEEMKTTADMPAEQSVGTDE